MKCFYHADADGRCAAFWVYFSADVTDEYEESHFIEMDYSKPFPLYSIRPDEQIYIVDYSIHPDMMRDLLEITKDVTWIDHHKTAIDNYTSFNFGQDIRGVRCDGVSACMLTYCYLHHTTAEQAPTFTKLIDDWDTWKFNYGDDTRYFVTALNAYDFNPQSCRWITLCSGSRSVDDLIAEGRSMIAFRDGWASTYMKYGYETEFDGMKCFAVNIGNANSEYFKTIDANRYDAFIVFVFNGEQFIVSLYSKTHDVSLVAKKYGGGGHAQAAGFTCESLPFYK